MLTSGSGLGFGFQVGLGVAVAVPAGVQGVPEVRPGGREVLLDPVAGGEDDHVLWGSPAAGRAAGVAVFGLLHAVTRGACLPVREVRADWCRVTVRPRGRRPRVAELVVQGALNDQLARQVLDRVLAGEGTPDEVVAARGLAVVSDEGALTAAVEAAIAANPDVAARIRDGKVNAAGVLVGAVMKATRGQADATRVRELILARLS